MATSDRYQRHQHAAVADAAQHGHRQDDHRQQPDGHGQAGEHHRPARVVHRLGHGGRVVPARRPLLAPAADHEQRVVDGHAQPDQRDQELDDLADPGDLGEPADEQERGQHRDAADEQRQQGQEAGEHQGQDDQRADRADHRLGHHPGALGEAGWPFGQQLRAGDPDVPAGAAAAAVSVRWMAGPRSGPPKPLTGAVNTSANVDRAVPGEERPVRAWWRSRRSARRGSSWPVRRTRARWPRPRPGR